MDTILKFLPYLIVIGIAIWIARSPDRLADVIRVKIFGMKSWATRELEDVNAESAKAVATAKNNRARAKARRNETRDAMNALVVELQALQKEIEPLERGADAAASQGKTDLVEQAEKDLEPLRTREDSLKTRIASYTDALKSIEADIAGLEKDIAGYEEKAADFAARSLRAKNKKDVDDLKRDMSDNSPKRMLDNAEKTLFRAEGAAMTASEDADVVRAEEKRREELASLSTGGSAPLNLEDRVAARMAKFAKPADTSTK
jgi:phage shock protein A